MGKGEGRIGFAGIATAVATNVIFGMSFLFSRAALTRGVPVATLLGLRFLLAFATMSLLLAFGVLKVDFRGKRLIHLLPIVLFQPVAYFLCETFGIRRTSSSEAGIIIALLPIVTVIVASVFLRERQPAGRTLFVLLSIAGAVLIVALSGTSPTFDAWGYLLLFGAVLAAAAFNTLVRHQRDRFTAAEMTYAMMATGTVVFGGAALAGTAAAPDGFAQLAGFLQDPMILAGVGYLGLFSSIVAFLLLNVTVRRLGAARAASFANITTVVSIAAGTLVLRESLEWYHFVGSGLILVGVWGANRPVRSPADAGAEDAAGPEAETDASDGLVAPPEA